MTTRTEPVPNCPLCGYEGRQKYEGLSDRLYGVAGRWNSMSCGQCGVLWLDPRPIPQDIAKSYPDEYFTHGAVEPLTLGRSERARQLRSAVLHRQFGYHHLDAGGRLLALLGRVLMVFPPLKRKLTLGLGVLLIPYQPDGRLLDIGCGSGAYVALMNELGWEVAGIEMDGKAVAVARSHFGLLIHNGTVDDAPFEEQSFDVVTMSHVLEHVPDPVSFLQAATRFVKPDGRIIIVTPNARSLGSSLFGKDWYALQPPQHLILYGARGLRRCLAQTGLIKHMRMASSARIARKCARKFVLVRRAGSFRNDALEMELSRSWWARVLGSVVELLEEVGNPIFRWGEEIECVAIKR